MKDGETGLLYSNTDEFEAKLETLSNDAELRLRLGNAAKEWIWENRHVNTTTPPLYEALTERLARHRAERRTFVPKTVESCEKLFRKA